MKKIIPVFFLILSAFMAEAQELGLQFGKSVSNFQYIDSKGVELKDLQKTDNFFMTAEYRQMIIKKPFKNRMFMDVGFAYNRYGSSGSDAVLDNYYTWDVNYLGVNLGADYVFYHNKNLVFYIKTTISPEFLIQGTQTLNNDVYNLVGEEDFNTPMFFFRGGLGTKFRISDEASVFVQYMGGKGYNFGSSEKLNIISHNIGFGLLFNLIKDPYQTEWQGDKRR